MRAGRIVSRKKREPIKPATLAGYQAAVNWLNETIGDTPLADIKNEVEAVCTQNADCKTSRQDHRQLLPGS